MKARKNTAISARCKSRRRWLVLAVASVSMLTMSSSVGLSQIDDRAADSSRIDIIVGSVNEFALDLYRELANTEKGKNIFLSPYSVYNALMMVAEGARGVTALEMGTVLRFPDAARNDADKSEATPWNTVFMHRRIKVLNEAIIDGSGTDTEEKAEVESEIRRLEEGIDELGGEIEAIRGRARSADREERRHLVEERWALEARYKDNIKTLNQLRQQVDRYELRIANALWTEKTFPFSEEYLGVLHDSYDAGVHAADFRGNPDGARQRINQWVEKATNHRIKDLVPEDALDEWARLVLTNAVYFKGNWRDQFDELMTEKADFTSSDESIAKVDLMWKRHMTCRYVDITPSGERNEPVWNEDTSQYETDPNIDGFQLLELAYRGDRISMLFILPRRDDGLMDLERDLSSETLDIWLGMLKQQQVHVYIPKYKMALTYSLKEPMKKLGMSSAFRPGGLTGISDSPMADSLFVSFITHKAFVELNEKGTEAAAATAIGVALKGVPPPRPPTPTFKADHPFIFLIRDVESGVILFCGRMVTPP